MESGLRPGGAPPAPPYPPHGGSTSGGAGTPLIGIVDYGMGNRRSVEKALEHVGARARLTDDHDVLRAADGLVVPGVGAFPEAMRRLDASGLADLIRERVAADTPTLGVCLGMQLAFDRSTELGGSPGLGIVPGEVRELAADALKVPHIGWSPVRWRAASPPACPTRARTRRHGRLLDGLPDEPAFYHVHSYVAVPADPADWLGTAEYGERFVSAVARGSFWGVQFHPEKSSTLGLRLLANFAAICQADADAAADAAAEAEADAEAEAEAEDTATAAAAAARSGAQAA